MRTCHRARPSLVRLKPVLLSFVFVFLIHTVESSDAPWDASEIPNPQGSGRDKCRRGGKSSAICDPDGYLSPSDGDTIDGVINFIHEGSHGFQAFPCAGGEPGAQLAVAIVSRMKGSAGVSSDKKDLAFRFARSLHDRWGVGDRACQNGVVLFFAITDRAMGFSIGAGLKSVITDEHVSAIMVSISDELRQGHYGNAIISAVTDIGNILSGTVPKDIQNSMNHNKFGKFAFGFIAAAVVGTIGISSVRHIRSRRRYARCKQVLETIDRDRTRANSHEYVATSCPICLEDFSDGASPVAQGHSPLPSADSSSLKTDRAMEMAPLHATRETSISKNSSGDEGNRVVTLPCGHMFHNGCVLRWIDGQGRANNTCPVCRRPVVSAPNNNYERDPNNEYSSSRNHAAGWDIYGDEYDFRLRRARHYYPEFVSWSMIDDWSRYRHDDSRNIATSPEFTAVDPVVVAEEARHAGGSGSTFTFGGGSSAGGGGGGGSW